MAPTYPTYYLHPVKNTYKCPRFVEYDHRRTTSVTHIQSKLYWQTLETRRLQHQLIFLCKIKYNLLNISLPQHIIIPCTRTRNSYPNKFVRIPSRINTNAYYAFYPRVKRACNLLPNEIIRLSSIETFHQAVTTVQLSPPTHRNVNTNRCNCVILTHVSFAPL